MFKKMLEKLGVFWEKHKVGIIAGGLTALGFAGTCYAIGYAMEKREEQQNDDEVINAIAADLNASFASAQHEAEATEIEDEDNPEYQLSCGGYMRPDNDWLSDQEYPGCLANSVPISSLGEFGADILNRLNEIQFGEFSEYNFDPGTATADIMIDFGHEMWKRNNPEEQSA